MKKNPKLQAMLQAILAVVLVVAMAMVSCGKASPEATAPTVETDAASSVTTTSATLNGDLTGLGTASPVQVSFEWGLTTGYGNATEAEAKTETGTFSADVSGLTPGATYYFRAKAVGDGTVYGDETTFTTTTVPPEVTANGPGAGDITAETAILTGNLTSLGTASSVQVSFEWGTCTDYGDETTPQEMTAAGTFTASLSGLTQGTTYHFRVKVLDIYGNVVYGADMTFTTGGTTPVVTTGAATGVGNTSATLNGNLASPGTASSVQVSFDWGLTAGYGNTTTPQTMSSTGDFSFALNSLSHSTTYHFRAVAVGDATGTGLDQIFTTLTPADTLTLNEHTVWYPAYGAVWCSVSVRDSEGKFVTGLSRDDFQLTETLVSPTGDVVEERPVTFNADDISLQFHGDGFWERSVTGQKLDIVFVVDTSNPMCVQYGAGIRSELHAFVDRLVAAHVDFRVGIVPYDSRVDLLYDPLSFQGPMKAEEIHQWIDTAMFSTCSTAHYETSAGYDALLVATDFDWRQDASVEKVAVIVTDTFPKTAYGAGGYSSGKTAATLPAVQLALQDTGIKLYYSQKVPVTRRDEPDYYTEYRADRNPRAWCGFDTLGTPISWPFQQEDIPVAAGGDVVDSKCYFAWVSGFEVVEHDLGDQGYRVKVTVKVADPAGTGQSLERDFRYGADVDRGTLTANITDETGQLLPGYILFKIRPVMGDRISVRYDLDAFSYLEGRGVSEALPAGSYLFTADTTAWNIGSFLMEALSSAKTVEVQLPAGGVTLSMQLETRLGDAYLFKARGLLAELKNWGYCDKPFAEFADKANAWLDEIENGGVDWAEMEKIKRFDYALAGYVDTTGYAEVEVVRGVQDFIEASKQARDMLQRLDVTSKDLSASLLDPDTLALLAAFVASQNTEATEAYGAEEIYTQAVMDYVKGPLVEEVIGKVIASMPDDVEEALGPLVIALVFGNWDDPDGVMQSVIDLGLDAAIDAVKAQLTQEATDALLDALDSQGVETPAVARAIIREAVEAFAQNGFDGWDNQEFNEHMNKAIEDAIDALGGKPALLAELDTIVSKLRENAAAGPLRDFVLPMGVMITKIFVENYNDGEIDDDFVIEVLGQLFCNWLVQRPFYSDPLEDDLYDLLDRAQAFDPGLITSNEDRVARQRSLARDIDTTFWELMRDNVNGEAWNKLDDQDSIDNWEDTLGTITTALQGLKLTTAVCGLYYPQLWERIDDVDDLIAFLDGIQILTNALQFGMKIDNMCDLQDAINDANAVLLPAP